MLPLIAFFVSLCVFHGSEFILAVIYMRQDLSRRCNDPLIFLLGICVSDRSVRKDIPSRSYMFMASEWVPCCAAWLFSTPYCFAMSIAVIEYILECSIPALNVKVNHSDVPRAMQVHWFAA